MQRWGHTTRIRGLEGRGGVSWRPWSYSPAPDPECQAHNEGFPVEAFTEGPQLDRQVGSLHGHPGKEFS